MIFSFTPGFHSISDAIKLMSYNLWHVLLAFSVIPCVTLALIRNLFNTKIIDLACLNYLGQILKENKDKKDAEFNERFKHSE